ncbi:MAG: mechanosensitive ion channel family protein [Pikeienuella sp.]
MLFPRSIVRLCVFLLCLSFASVGSAQVLLGGSSSSGDGPVSAPATLTPEIIDGLLSRLTDAEIRAAYREELQRQAAEQAAGADSGRTFDEIERRFAEMRATIFQRTSRWATAIWNIGDRSAIVESRRAEAKNGVAVMLVAAAGLIGLGVAAAQLVGGITARWRLWLMEPHRRSYWDKVVRSAALGALEVLPIIAFVVVTRLAAPLIADQLGPLSRMIWIYHTGVSYAWLMIVFIRRAFAPDAPDIRIARLSDDNALRLHRLLRRAVQISAVGWLSAGLALHLGYGFPPAMIINALAGTAIAALLLLAVSRNMTTIRTATSGIFAGKTDPGAFERILVNAAPVLLILYILGAWAWWLAHWLEQGRHQLDGPLGTLMIYLLLPIADRVGQELIGSTVTGYSDMAERFRAAFRSVWRVLVGIGAAWLVLRLWDVGAPQMMDDGPQAAWVGIATNVIVALLIGWIIWRMIGAALHYERRTSDASEDVDPSEIPSASRLDTLTPLFRNVLFAFLATVILMIVLSSVGLDIGPLIASAGIIGIAVGFGAQALVRDVLSGVFFLIDDAFRVGEYIELDDNMRGEVENISIRSLQLRHHRGAVITIPFGELRQITNHNRDWIIYKMMFRLEPDTDPQHVKKTVKKVGAEFMQHPDHGPKFIEPLKSQGVYFIDDDSALMIRVKFKCKPRAQFVLRREIYHRLRTVFAEQDIRFARRKIEVVGADGEPVADPKTAAIPEDVLTKLPPPAPT